MGYAVPTPPPEANTCADLLDNPLTGWEEIRNTLSCIEELRRSGNGSAIVEVVDRSTESSVRVAFSTVAELDEYLKSNFRHTPLDGFKGTLTLEKQNNAM